MKHSWSRQSGSKIAKDSSERTEEYFKKEFTEAMDRRPSLTMRKGKRYRSAFTTDQVNYLEKQFKKFPYIGTAHRKEVAVALDIHERAVKIWFQNRRMKEKKEMGSKDLDSDDQTARKNVGLVNDKSNNAPPVVNDPCYSLPQLTVPAKNNLTNENTNNDIAKLETIAAKVTEPIKLNYYNDISPVREPVVSTVPFSNLTPPKITPQVNYRSSAEFSIDLCKKYKNNFEMADQGKVENNSFAISDLHVNNNKIHVTPPPNIYRHDELPKIEPQSLPEDLSCRSAAVKREQSPPKNVDANGQSYIPFYVNYPQPYLTAGNMLWKPVNVLPIVSTGVPAVNISSNHTGSLSVAQEPGLPRKKCNCNCHLELPSGLPIPDNATNPQAQYVITALPFQNYPKF